MAFNIFKRKKAEPAAKKETLPVLESDKKPVSEPRLGKTVPARQVLVKFYISEKSARLNSMNQYVFKVKSDATKNEIKKAVSSKYNVRVTGIRVLNMPAKSRNVGRHSGFKQGYRKAIVVLAAGDTIAQARA